MIDIIFRFYGMFGDFAELGGAGGFRQPQMFHV
jgi:hypothetical protein